MFVGAGGEEGGEDGSASSGHRLQAFRQVSLDEVEHGGEDHVVRREIGGHRHDIDVGSSLAGGSVVSVYDVLVPNQSRGAVGDLQRPPAVPVEEERGAGRGPGTQGGRSELAQFPAEGGDFTEHTGVVAARVADHRAVVPLAGAA